MVIQFHEPLNSLIPSIEFKTETEKSGVLLFLDFKVDEPNNCFKLSIWRNPTHTAQTYSAKKWIIRTLIAKTFCSTSDPLLYFKKQDLLRNVHQEHLIKKLFMSVKHKNKIGRRNSYEPRYPYPKRLFRMNKNRAAIPP